MRVLSGPVPGRGLFVALMVAILLAVYTRTFVVQGFHIPSDSMAPALIAGDHILVNKFIYAGARYPESRWARILPVRDVRRGDVAVFRSPPGPVVIKRCLGLPGETVEMRRHQLKIDGVLVDESGYLNTDDAYSWPAKTSLLRPVIVPRRQYFCLGDHRPRSRDSRSWGTVPASALIGRAVLIYGSARPVEQTVEKPVSWDKLMYHRWSRFRWERSFAIIR